MLVHHCHAQHDLDTCGRFFLNIQFYSLFSKVNLFDNFPSLSYFLLITMHCLSLSIVFFVISIMAMGKCQIEPKMPANYRHSSEDYNLEPQDMGQRRN